MKWRRSRGSSRSKVSSSARKQRWIYAALLAGCFGTGMLVSLSPPAKRVNNIAYDWTLSNRGRAEWTPQSAVVEIDDDTLRKKGGMRAIRSILAEVVDQVNAAEPAAVADDILLADPTNDDAGNAALALALRGTRKLILPCDLITGNGAMRWEDPLPEFKGPQVKVGHVSRQQDLEDGVNRYVPLEEIAQNDRRWALALETFGAVRDALITEDVPDKLDVGKVVIPARESAHYQLWIRYLRSGVPVVSALEIDRHRDLLRGRAVFVGITAPGASRDRPVTPLGEISGVELHAQIYETIAHGDFLIPVRNDVEWLLCAVFTALAGLIFAYRSGWQAYTLAGLVMGVSAWTPVEFFDHDRIFPFFEPVFITWLSIAAAATFQYFFVRRELRKSESERSRYQQALHWAAHEMRTPLTAIQGSSEIMTRYKLPEAKQHELSAMINSESKRLARLIQTFLDVERMADGQMEMKREPFAAAEVVETCMQRAEPIAEPKNIRIFLDNAIEGTLVGDRELMEYALYNLLTNAIKYSPAETEIHVFSEFHARELRLSVRDQGIGMDAKELKQIFKKFYRTKRAEASGEKGTGIGLSIVEQIVSNHGGRMEVTSEPAKGSCFTMILTASRVPDATASHAETSDRRG